MDKSATRDWLQAAEDNPAKPRGQATALPIILVGGGGIVRNAHLPAYRKAGFPVAAIIDPHVGKAQELAAMFDVACATDSVEKALQATGKQPCIFDVAIPAKELPGFLPQLPDGSAVLIQKPMGETLGEAQAILNICREKRLTAAVNFQLRWSPAMLAAKELYRRGAIGVLHDMEIQVSTHTPWELWTFLQTAPRLEILYHSIHYIDLVRDWLGNPRRVFAKTVKNPRTPDLAPTKSVILLDYSDMVRVVINTNHGQSFAPAWQHSYVQWEGTKGLMRAQMGVNLDYPVGKQDYLLYVGEGSSTGAPETIPISGNWFPDAFIGSMGSLQSFVAGQTTVLPTSVEDAVDTMKTVEAAYLSSERGGEPLPTFAKD